MAAPWKPGGPAVSHGPAPSLAPALRAYLDPGFQLANPRHPGGRRGSPACYNPFVERRQRSRSWSGPRARAARWALCALGAVACGRGHRAPPELDWRPPELGADPLAPLRDGPADAGDSPPPGSVSPPAVDLCERGHDDAVHDAACAGGLLEAESLLQLYGELDLDPTDRASGTGAVFSAHTTSLSTRSVSAINPRAILLRAPSLPPGKELLLAAFTRGEQAVELATRDRESGVLRFYLLTYEQACDDSPEGCGPAELLTERTERGWRRLQLLDDDDLRNTVLDCMPCHQPSGVDTPPILRMFEAQVPYTHWLWRHGPGGSALLADYVAVHGRSAYAGVPWEVIHGSEPGMLTSVLSLQGYRAQPSVFDGATIELEVKRSAEGQPADNDPPGESATWEATRREAAEVDGAALPHHDVKVTDPRRLAALADLYRGFREGRVEAEALPDLRDVLWRDPVQLAHMGLLPDPDLEGEALLRAACGRCHDGRLDAGLTRANFDVRDFLDGGAGRQEIRERAIDRLMRAPDAPGAMPPPRLLGLLPEQREALVELFERR